MTAETDKKPTHGAYTVRPYTDRSGMERARWTSIGVAWAHRNGGGFNLHLDAVPLDGQITLFTLDRATPEEAPAN